MRIALIADVHANLVALEAVAAGLANDRPERTVFLGDALGMGPHPVEVLERLEELCDVFVMGNVDAEALEGHVPEDAVGDARRFYEISRWTGEQLGASERAFVSSFVPHAEVDDGDFRLLAYHGSPHSFDDRIYPTSPVEELEGLLGTLPADVYAGGHTHMQFVRRHRKSLVVNPGSAGFAYDRDARPAEDVRMAAFAEYALVDVGEAGPSISLGRVPFDVARHVTALRSCGMPHAEWLAEGYG